MSRRVAVLTAAVIALTARVAIAQDGPAKIYVEGGPKAMKEAVLALLRASSDLNPVPYVKQPEANIDLQKSGGAKVKCGDAKTYLPGPTAEDIVSQFRDWLSNGPLKKRRAEHAARSEAIANAFAAAGAGLSATTPPSNGFAATAAGSSPELLLFGGRDHDVFLGCLTCNEYASNSVRNPYGNYGSKYSSTSIANPYNQYGGKYSSEGACNPYANTPPVIVDRAGNYYGELTMNRYSAKRTKIVALLQWLAVTCAE